MKNQKPFFKNAFKNLIRNKIQLITIIILVFLTSFVFTLSYSSTSRIQKSYENFISEKNSNIHDFIIDLSKSSYINDFEKDLFGKNISNSDVRDNLLITYLQNKFKNTDFEFEFDRVESRTTTLSTNKTLKVFALNPDQKVDRLVVGQGMSLDLWKKYTQSINVTTKKWVYVNEQFANANDIKINDIIRLQDDEYGTTVKVKDSEIKKVDFSLYEKIDINSWIKNTEYANQNWFQVVGFGSTADFSTPIIDETKPLPNTKEEGLIYIDPSNLGLKNVYYQSVFSNNELRLNDVDWKTQKMWYTDSEIKNEEIISAASDLDKEITFVGKFKNSKDIRTSTNIVNEYLTNLDKAKEIELYAGYENTLNKSIPIAIQRGSQKYKFSSRTSMLNMTISSYKAFSFIVMLVTLSIGIVMLIIMLNNQIKKTFGQSGVLLSLGYKKSSLIWSNGLYPLFISITGGLLGYILGMGMQEFVISIVNNFFSIQMLTFELSWESVLVVIFGMFIFLEIITLITYFYMFGKYTPLQMINFESRSSTNKFKLTIKKILTRGKGFNSRFKGAILSGSVMKLVSVFSVMLISSTLITIGTSMPNILTENKNKTYIKDGYDNLIEYQSPIYNSPTSFYKTYNPYSTSNNADVSLSKNIWDMYLKNDISQKIYNPSTDVGSLNDMTYKSLDLDYLKNDKLTIDLGNMENQKEQLYKTVMLNLWPDLKNYGIDKYWNKNSLLDILVSDSKSKENIEDLEKIRQFYLKYKNALGIENIPVKSDSNPRKDYFRFVGKDITLKLDGGPIKDGSPMISEKDFKDYFQDSNLTRPIISLQNTGQIKNDEPFELSLYEYIDKDTWMEKRVTTIVTIYNWIIALFYNNLQQAFLQGIYNQSPALIQKTIQQEFKKEDGNFNVTFGLIPYNEQKEDLGIFLNGYSQDQSMKIYGIKKDNKTQILNDTKENDLKNKLFESKNSILINQSLAKRLKLKTGDKINISHILNSLAYEQNELEIDSWDTSSLDATNTEDEYTSGRNFYSSTMMGEDNKGWKNSKFESNEDNDSRVYKSKINLASPSLVGATKMSQAVSNGTISTKNIENDFEYTVVGVVDQYGDNKAWIHNDTAKEVSKYSETEELLFRLFMKEWSNPEEPNSDILKLKNFINELENNNPSNKEAFLKFKEFTNQSENEIYLKLFESQYPLFNYKTSFDDSFTDISKGVSSNQKFGDYSMIGLNGGSDNTTSYTGYSNSSINEAMKIDEALKVINRINSTVDIIIFFVVFVSIFLSAIIILLTINLVISENAKIIAVMKILGYKETYISKLFIGIYIPVAIISSLIGFAVGWAIVVMGVHLFTNSMVLPLTFQIWYIVPGVLGTWLLYTISNALSWFSLKKVSMLLAVQGG
ncbi:ABC transporter permease [Spiroplasma diminutum]|uniref:ABC transporter permease n=1 Tax=Spiroplasma diminutum CUAS-1 TaxID=1276221 RepID=S5LXA7_9MOLU|nr:ABC transporter permease [Spiroplasma diminutum]AGR42449.1 ABC transporter permease [Spiroplasma diminutum CUAS-1]